MWGNNWNWSEALTQFQMRLGAPEGAARLVAYGLGAVVLVTIALILVLFLIWVTRKVVSRIQDRLGPNRLGPYGLFQSVADALKLLTKEDITPRNADVISYNLAPVFDVFGVFLTLTVVAWAPGLIGADLNIGVPFLVALGAIGIMSALMAGWSSSNKYALLSGFRVVAQLLSYEIPMVLSMFLPVLLIGSMKLGTISASQSLYLFGFNLGLGWTVFIMPAAALIYFISALAEAEQTPFDLLEAESELIAGFHIEYSGMKFAMFFLAQFMNSFFLGAIAVMLFFGGYQGPFVDQLPILGAFYLLIKAMLVYLVTQWIKGTFPRLRVDQMMQFAWKVLVPLVLALVLWQMIVMKIFSSSWMQDISILIGNLVVGWVVLNVVSNYLRRQKVVTKRAFEPKSLIGVMEPVVSSGD
ncbi:MAG: NADH-quinone oxidoreductase subunit H [Caldilineaceae bacterium]|nr:NADH-quinone oxidoreductase subunit H [Caldilineaceae bacterium]